MINESLMDIDHQKVKLQFSLAISQSFCDNKQISSYEDQMKMIVIQYEELAKLV